MRNLMFILYLLLVSQVTLAQKQVVEAIYCGDDDVPYKIETKYTENNTVIYVSHYNDESACLKRTTVQSKDTVIVTETYYDIVCEKTKIENFQSCNFWKVVRDADSFYYKGYQQKLGEDTMRFMGDTATPVIGGISFTDFSEAVKKLRVSMILDNKITVRLDSLIPQETIKAYYLNGFPVKVEIFDADMKMYNLTNCNFSGNELIAKLFFVTDKLENYEMITFKWNSDTTKIKMRLNRYEWKEKFLTSFEINKNTLKEKPRGSHASQTEFLEPANIFKNILITYLVYNDVFRVINFRYFDRQKIASEKTRKTEMKYEYSYDDKHRITEVAALKNGELQEQVLFRFVE